PADLGKRVVDKWKGDHEDSPGKLHGRCLGKGSQRILHGDYPAVSLIFIKDGNELKLVLGCHFQNIIEVGIQAHVTTLSDEVERFNWLFNVVRFENDLF